MSKKFKVLIFKEMEIEATNAEQAAETARDIAPYLDAEVTEIFEEAV